MLYGGHDHDLWLARIADDKELPAAERLSAIELIQGRLRQELPAVPSLLTPAFIERADWYTPAIDAN